MTQTPDTVAAPVGDLISREAAVKAASEWWREMKDPTQSGPVAAALRTLPAAPEAFPTCRKCAGEMRPGIAIGQTFTAGLPDDLGGDAQTMSAGGPGCVIDCWKCVDCGWSVTEPAAPEAAEVERLEGELFAEGEMHMAALARAERAEARLAEVEAERDAALAQVDNCTAVMFEIREFCRNSGRGSDLVNDRIIERCEEAAEEALTADAAAALERAVEARVQAALSAQGEPVAWRIEDRTHPGWWTYYDPKQEPPIGATPLYAHPTPASAGVTVKQAAQVLLACNGADLDEWTGGLWPDDDATEALEALAALSPPAQGGERGA